MTQALQKLLAKLEGRRRDDYESVHSAVPGICLCLVAASKRGRWKLGQESVLTAYSRACGYRGGVEELARVALNKPYKFHQKHVAVERSQTREHTNEVRLEVIRELMAEELCWQLLELAEAEGIAGFPMRTGPSPLSPVRPFRAAV